MRQNKPKTVLASGFFDPPHRGHVEHLKAARQLGDKLIVHIHRDECCIKKKGYCFMPLDDRKAIIENLKFVDEVVVCDEDCDLTVAKTLEKLRPSIFAKGGDRTIQNLPRSEVETCEKLGIKIVTGVGGGKVQSSSWIIENLKKLITRGNVYNK